MDGQLHLFQHSMALRSFVFTVVHLAAGMGVESCRTDFLQEADGLGRPAAVSPFAEVVQQMTRVNEELCIWLYGEGISGIVDTVLVHETVGDVVPVRTLESVDRTREVYREELDQIRQRVATALFCLVSVWKILPDGKNVTTTMMMPH